MVWTDYIEGTLPADDLRRAFVMGAKWWEWQKTGATMWPSDRNDAEAKAEEVFPGGRPPIVGPDEGGQEETATMNAEQLREIRERCEAATPGPWIAKRFDPYRNRAAIYQTPEAQKVNPLRWQVAAICREARAQDADFIEHARTDIPALLAEVERLRAALERVSKIYPTPYVKRICDDALEETP